MSDEPTNRLIEVSNRGWDERLRVFCADDEVETFALLTRRYFVLIDTTATPETAAAILAAVRPSLDGRQLLVVNTHADYDHAWGNAVFAGPDAILLAPIIAHEKARERLASQQAHDDLAKRQRENPRFASVRLVAPTLTFVDTLKIHGGDLTLELLPTPGHTADHISIWIPELRLLLAGDAAEHPFPYVHAAADLPILLASLRRLVDLHPALVLPCHGETTDPALLTRNLAYFAAIEHHARDTMITSRIPANWREREDLPELIGFPYEAALRLAETDPATVSPAFSYRGFHLEAVRATLGNFA